jgi:hypothetical protein
MPAALALAIPSSWRSFRGFVSNSEKDAEHIEKALASGSPGIDRLLGGLQRCLVHKRYHETVVAVSTDGCSLSYY